MIVGVLVGCGVLVGDGRAVVGSVLIVGDGRCTVGSEAIVGVGSWDAGDAFSGRVEETARQKKRITNKSKKVLRMGIIIARMV